MDILNVFHDSELVGHIARAWFANLLPEGEIRGHAAGRPS